MQSRRTTRLAVLAALIIAAGCSDDNPVVEMAAETVSAPKGPAGPTSILFDSLTTYFCGGAESNLGHGVEYQFAWGDGRLSAWLAPGRAAVSWPTPGSRDVRARARCMEHTDVESGWSIATSVRVGFETVTAPSAPAGIGRLCAGSISGFRSGGATSDVGHPVEYQFDWSDGLSYWLSVDSICHAWSLAGDYDCRARARCALDTTVVSNWSPPVSVTIESHSTPWIIETDLPGLVGPELGARVVRVSYDGPRARITRLKLDLAGRAAGTTCQDPYNGMTYTLNMILWPSVGIEGKDGIWNPLGMFFGLPASDFDVHDYWVSEDTDDWVIPKILEPGDLIRIRLSTQVDDYIGSCGRGNAFCDITYTHIALELECASE